jgi:hypothetical protein
VSPGGSEGGEVLCFRYGEAGMCITLDQEVTTGSHTHPINKGAESVTHVLTRCLGRVASRAFVGELQYW